jgi:hypothetical protein
LWRSKLYLFYHKFFDNRDRFIYVDKGFVRDNKDKWVIINLGKPLPNYRIKKVITTANYLEVPLLINYTLTRKPRVHLYSTLKYLPAFLLNNSTRFEYNTFNVDEEVEEQFKNNISSFVTTIGMGIGTNFRIAEKTWLGAEYTLRAHMKKTDFKNIKMLPYPGLNIQASLLFDLY